MREYEASYNLSLQLSDEAQQEASTMVVAAAVWIKQ